MRSTFITASFALAIFEVVVDEVDVVVKQAFVPDSAGGAALLEWFKLALNPSVIVPESWSTDSAGGPAPRNASFS